MSIGEWFGVVAVLWLVVSVVVGLFLGKALRIADDRSRRLPSARPAVVEAYSGPAQVWAPEAG